MKCLIVEDDPTSQLILKEYLQPYGTCHVTENGLLAVHTYRSSLEERNHYDLLCLDVLMPLMDGHSIIDEIRTMEKLYNIPDKDKARIMMVSILCDPFVISRAYELGCDAYLVKPVDEDKLHAEMEKLGFSRR